MAKDDDIVWLMVYHPGTDCRMALPWHRNSGVAKGGEGQPNWEFVDRRMADEHNASLDQSCRKALDDGLTRCWSGIAEIRKGRG
jgi:hypothetical protein